MPVHIIWFPLMKNTTTLLLGQGEISLFTLREVEGHWALITGLIIINNYY